MQVQFQFQSRQFLVPWYTLEDHFLFRSPSLLALPVKLPHSEDTLYRPTQAQSSPATVQGSRLQQALSPKRRLDFWVCVAGFHVSPLFLPPVAGGRQGRPSYPRSGPPTVNQLSYRSRYTVCADDAFSWFGCHNRAFSQPFRISCDR